MNKLRVVGWILRGMVTLSGILFLIGWLIDPVAWHKPLSYLATVLLPYLPEVLRLVRIRPSEQLVVAYEIFLIIAMILGIDFDWYATVLVAENGDSYFDKIVHMGSGVLTAFMGKELLDRQKWLKNCPGWFSVVFIIGVTLIVAFGWECFEFFYDLLFGGSMQELTQHGVADTMWDMVVATVGGGVAAGLLVKFDKR